MHSSYVHAFIKTYVCMHAVYVCMLIAHVCMCMCVYTVVYVELYMRIRVQIRQYIEYSEPDTCGHCLPLQHWRRGCHMEHCVNLILRRNPYRILRSTLSFTVWQMGSMETMRTRRRRVLLHYWARIRLLS